MKPLHSLLLTVTVGLLMAADNPKEEAAKKEREILQGTWKLVSAEWDGKPDDLRFTENTTLRISKDGKCTLKLPWPQGVFEGTYLLDPTQKPKTVDYNFKSIPVKGKPLAELGIYSLEGDTLKICKSVTGKERPKEFATKPDDGRSLYVFQRELPPAAPVKPVAPVFPDKNLEEAVRAVLHEPKAELNDSNLGNVHVLEASGKNITNLKGLERCKNLALLKLSKNQIVELAPLKELTNLQSLDLSGNKIADITALKDLTKLQYLELSNNQIAKADAVNGLVNLSALYLTGNKITDIGPLGKLSKLSSLYLGHNQIKDITVLSKVTKLSSLELNDNQIADLSPLTKQTELSILLLDRNKITDLTPLVNAAKADADGQKRFAPYLRLYLSGNPLSDAAKSDHIKALKGYGVKVEQ